MGGLSVWHWLIFLVVALLLFGGSGKISSIMGDVAKGIKSFKKGMTEEDEPRQAGIGPLQEGRTARHRQRGCQTGHDADRPAQTPQANKAG